MRPVSLGHHAEAQVLQLYSSLHVKGIPMKAKNVKFTYPYPNQKKMKFKWEKEIRNDYQNSQWKRCKAKPAFCCCHLLLNTGISLKPLPI